MLDVGFKYSHGNLVTSRTVGHRISSDPEWKRSSEGEWAVEARGRRGRHEMEDNMREAAKA